ncbi:hypothetical protein ACFWPU_13850 [Streptomyces sp. NPDC058471]|uniref:hypothetical protein n=1 Tax=Streptomyces sp. NPDC058471 TaxID=3346516 RepID=UPI00365FE991
MVTGIPPWRTVCATSATDPREPLTLLLRIAGARRASLVSRPQRTNFGVSHALQLRQGERFERDPWYLGSWSALVGTIAVVWVLVITVLFMLPQTSPITAKTFKYAPIAVGGVVVCGTQRLASARKRFLNPAHTRNSTHGPKRDVMHS